MRACLLRAASVVAGVELGRARVEAEGLVGEWNATPRVSEVGAHQLSVSQILMVTVGDVLSLTPLMTRWPNLGPRVGRAVQTTFCTSDVPSTRALLAMARLQQALTEGEKRENRS